MIPRRVGPSVVAMALAGMVAAVTSTPWVGLAACAVLVVAALRFAARLARPPGATPSTTRTIVVLAALAYLIGLPATWLVTRHLDALAAD